MAFGHLLDDRPQKTIFLLEAALILGQEPVEVMKKHPVEDGPLGMTRAVDSCMAGAIHQETDQIAQSKLSAHIRLEEAAQETTSFIQRVNSS